MTTDKETPALPRNKEDKATAKAAYGKGRTVKKRAEANGNTTALGRLQQVLTDIDLADVGEVRTVWAKTATDDDGTSRMTGASILLAPSWEGGPKWPVVQQAAPCKVTVPRRNAPALVGKWKTALILPDPQIGFRRLTDGTLDPFHDDRAIDIALQLAEAERPDLAVWLGDFLDFPSFGRYRQEPGFAMTTQPAIDKGHALLAQVAALAKESRLIEGNHDARLHNAIIDNASAAFGIRRANAPDEWPAMSVPYLLRLDELGVEYVPGYPVGATYINDNLAAIHGRKHRSNGSTASLVAGDERVSVIFGHVHRIETTFRTRNARAVPKFSVAHTPGCLCRIDGAVPGAVAGLDPHGTPVRHWQNWQQGVSVVRFEEGNGRFYIESVPIFEGWAMHRGHQFQARPND